MPGIGPVLATVMMAGIGGVSGVRGPAQVGGCALNLEHAEQVAVGGDMVAEPAGLSECQAGDPVRAGEPDHLDSVRADLLFGGRGRGQVRRPGKWLARCLSVAASDIPARRSSLSR